MGDLRVERLSRAFYERDSLTVARDLLGKRLIRVGAGERVAVGERLAGFICETEAYGGPDDPASHAYRRTGRSAIMYGLPGFSYVYFIYGAHYCLNVVTDPDGVAGAVLIRALIPGENLAEMRRRRGLSQALPANPLRGVADGPGKLCRALGITLEENGLDLTQSDSLFIEEGAEVPEGQVEATPRVGVGGDEEARSRPWRFYWSAGQ
jgi:DNA-3-methyladenine glycosylase